MPKPTRRLWWKSQFTNVGTKSQNWCRQESPLYLAVRHGHLPIVELLLARGVRIDARLERKSVDEGKSLHLRGGRII